MTDAHATLRQVIQRILDGEQEGWQLTHYVLVVGVEQMDSAGAVASTAWVTAPEHQADYITDGLIYQAQTMRWEAEIDDD